MPRLLSFFFFTFFVASSWAQVSPDSITATVPPLIKVSGVLANAQGTVGVTFALYAKQTDEAPLWLETQNVIPDANGRYTIYLGANHANGVPLNLFASGEAQWLGVQPEGQAEQARVQLVSVPYAMTAGDAQTLGGQPLSAFVLASVATGSTAAGGTATANAGSGGIVSLDTPQGSAAGNVTTSGNSLANYLAKFTSPTNIENSSVIYDSGTAVGIGTTAPAATFHVVSTVAPAGIVDVYSNTLNGVPFATRAARVATGGGMAVVQAGDIIGGFTGKGWTGPISGSTGGFSGGRGALLVRANETWSTAAQSTYIQVETTALGTNYQAERVRIDNAGNVGIATTNPGGTPPSPLAAPAVLEVNGNVKLTAGSGGVLTFADGSTQTTAFTGPNGGVYTAGAGLNLIGSQFSIAPGGVTSAMLANPSLTVTAGSGLTGGGAVALGGSTTLSLDLTNVPLLNASNNFAANQAITGNLTATGMVTGSVVNAASSFNLGGQAFAFGSTANYNAFLGFAGNSTTTGYGNTASGYLALATNTTGSNNTAMGDQAGGMVDGSDLTGANNTAIGSHTTFSTGTLTNATAIGANAEVGVSDALVLGSISGVNGCTSTNNCASVNVGIGTPAPAYTLDVHGTGNFTGLVTFATGQTFPGTGVSITSPNGTITVGGAASAPTLDLSPSIVNSLLAIPNLGSPGPLGGTTPNTGSFTTINATANNAPAGTFANLHNTLAQGAPEQALQSICLIQLSNGRCYSASFQSGDIFGSTTGTHPVGTATEIFAPNPAASYYSQGIFGQVVQVAAGSVTGDAGTVYNGSGFRVEDGQSIWQGTNTGGVGAKINYGFNTVDGIANISFGAGAWCSPGSAGSSNSCGSQGMEFRSFNNGALGIAYIQSDQWSNLYLLPPTGAHSYIPNAILQGPSTVNGSLSVAGDGGNVPGASGTLTANYFFGDGSHLTNLGLSIIAGGGVTNNMLVNPFLNVTAGTGLTGGGAVALGSGTTLNLDLSQVPLLGASNGFTANQAIAGNLTASGTITGGVVNATASINLAGKAVAFGNFANSNAFLGFAGNGFIATGSYNNTASGANALFSNGAGSYNTASGADALYWNTTGWSNNASGANALFSNNTGSYNTADGANALGYNTAGSFNTALGYSAGGTAESDSVTGSNNTFIGANTTVGAGTFTNATAIGANAEVDISNALVLGSINGVNGATAGTNVGIGTPAPAYTLDVHGTGNFTGLVNFAAGQTVANFSGLFAGDVIGTQGATSVVKINGGAIPVSAAVIGSNGNGQFVAQAGTLSNNISGNAATVTNGAYINVANNFTAVQTITATGTTLTVSGGSTGVSASGVAYGLYGTSASASGAGVYGYASSSSGLTTGTFGMSDSSTGTGVTGIATSSTGANYGVSGRSYSTTGTGVYGYASSAGGGYGVWGQSVSSSGIAGVFNNTAGGKILSGQNNSTEKFFVDGNGNIGMNGCLKTLGGTTLTGTCSSDVRLKTDIVPFAPVLGKLVQLQPVHYRWRVAQFPEYHFGEALNSGLLAQEVEKVFPEMVGIDGHGYKTVNYSELPYLLLGAVRELKAENDALQAKLSAQTELVRAIESRLAKLEQKQESEIGKAGASSGKAR